MNTLLIPVGLVMAPLIGALLVAAFALRSPRTAQVLALIGMSLSVAAAVAVVVHCSGGSTLDYEFGGWAAAYGIAARIDGLGAVVTLLIAGIGFVVLLYAGPSLRSELPGDEPTFFAVASLLVASLQGMVITGDLFNLYVFLEISAITAYALIASGGGAASLASYRYLIIGTIGASFYLLGVGYLLSIAGTLNMADLAARLPQLADSPAASVALALMVSGLALKMAVVPMHGWLPDAYTYAPSAATALIAGLMTKVSAFALLRILYSIFAPAMPEVISVVSTLLGALACAGILFGSFMAVAQTDFKRMLAYSSITHLGFVAMGLALGNEAGLLGAMLHIVAHAITKACLFLIAGGVSFRHGSRSIDSFSGLHRNMPLTMAALVVAALSMIGIPPTVGFFSKWYLLVGALQANRPEYFVVLLVSTLLSAWYFLRIVEKVYFGADSVKRPRQELPGAMLAPIAATALAVILVGLATSSLIERLLRQPIHTIAVVQQAAESIPEVRHVRR